MAPAGGKWKSICPVGRRGPDGRLKFKAKTGSSSDVTEAIAAFQPTVTPPEVLQAGAFGGTYFRDISSAVTKQIHKGAWKDLPTAWFKGLDIPTQVARPWDEYDVKVNKYGARCGNTLEDWEKSGWIIAQDPYGWFQWYCRFFLGRRTDDDVRQIKRWLKVCGPTGRWKGNLVAKCLKAGRPYNDPAVAPAVRQSLLHWGYELTAADLRAKKGDILAGKGAYAMPREELAALHRAARKRPAAASGAAAKRRKRS
eukprot:TRINITY_DN55877_c0_g1_i1.p1 TRINITY_DN55877_c0_g1~~TRINITY_DN55877_c0_g1_i1.p1  ORF type:complete len:279 (-),score=63.08 TRINITY_DN55877_c0_g1_i1:54-815(-)